MGIFRGLGGGVTRANCGVCGVLIVGVCGGLGVGYVEG